MIIASLNEKGGVGKTTIIYNVLGGLASKGNKVILVDAEPQGSASQIAAKERLNFEVISWSERDFEDPTALAKMKREIGEIYEKGEYDYLGIDTEPGFHGSSVLAARVAQLALIPIGASALDLWATKRTIDFVQDAQEDQMGKPIILVVPNRIQQGTIIGKDLQEMLPNYGHKVTSPVCLRVEMAEAAMSGQWVGDYFPKGKSVREIVDIIKMVEVKKDGSR